MTKTIRFSNGRLEQDGGIVAAPLTGFVRLEVGKFESRWHGQFSFESALDSSETALLIIPGTLSGLIHLDHVQNGLCDFSGADAPDMNEHIT